ncbi:hypothetical protein BC937DRAFT_86683 [Endogone sp. FLAS-F59071]|nr:hypothetical protein BC937DRAFT_86683 [Endogone sp. FLAS-F59071]|eukprot:RUS19944.1 hypothetical protein BC937DRAFT_86683 [Endogone sp. FLAS-F59071]
MFRARTLRFCKPQPCTRFFTTADRSFVSKFSSLQNIAPIFALRGEDIRPITEPSAFHSHLKTQIMTAKKRISMAALYVGATEQELIDMLRIALSGSPSLQVQILIDCLRGTRVTKDQSSATLLLPLLQAFPDQVKVSLYHTPDLKGVLKKALPQRFNEGIGLMHIKVFGFDDRVLLSGANINHDYFTDRQDRYIAFDNAPALSDYYVDLIRTVSSFSYQLLPNVRESQHALPYTLAITNETPDPVHSSTLFKAEASKRMDDFIKKWMLSTNPNDNGHPQHNRLSSTNPQLNELSFDSKSKQYDTLVVPVVQMGPLGVRQDEAATVRILDIADNHGKKADAEERFWTIFLTSGYFNFTNMYKSRVLKTAARFRLLTASPEANSFFNSRGVSKYLPPAYTLIEHQFLTDVIRHKKGHLIGIEEYRRPGWTYHAKGLWIYPENESWPSLTMIGSSNFGYRSSERDLEAQAIVITRHTPLRKAIHFELDSLRKHFEEVNLQTFEREDRKVPYLVRLATSMIRTML